MPITRHLGRFVVRFRYLVVAVWVLAALWMATQAPHLKDISVSELSEFLPASAPSLQAQLAINAAFPDEANLGNAVIVCARPGGLTNADSDYIRSLVDWLQSPAAPAVTGEVLSVFTRQGTESLFTSADKSTMLVSVGFTTGPVEEATAKAVHAIRDRIAATPPPAGMTVNVTGSSAISSDQRAALMEGIDRTTIATVLLVIAVLLLIYRSPVAALAPLITISMAYLVARGILAYAAAAGMKISSFVDAFSIVLIFGVGTDYCLFILSRFREELGRRATRDESIIVTMSAIGAVITASAATVILSLVLMVTGEFNMLQTMGPALGLGVFITLLAGLTLTPALVAIAGHYLFWPRHDEVQHEGGQLWQRIADLATRRYALLSTVIVVALLIPYLVLPQLRQTFDVLSELPDDTDSVQGFRALTAGFDAGELLPLTVLLTAPEGSILDHLPQVAQFSETLQAAPEVQRIRSLLEPTGDARSAAMFHVHTQIRQAADALSPTIKALEDTTSLAGSTSGASQSGIGLLKDFMTEVGRLPSVAVKPALAEATSRLQAVDRGLARMNELTLVSAQLEGLAQQMVQVAQTLKSGTTAGASAADPSSEFKDLASYLAQLGQAQPSLAKQASYQDAVKALDTLSGDIVKAQEMLLVTNQLGLLAKQLQDLSQTLSSPLGALALMGGGSQQLSALAGYYADLAKAYPAVAADSVYQDSLLRLKNLDTAAKQMVTNPPADLTAAMAALRTEIDALAANAVALRQTFSSQNAKAQLLPQNLQALAGSGSALPDPSASAQRLADSLAALAATAKTQMPTATFLPKDIPLSPAARQAIAALKLDMIGLQTALNRLATDLAAEKPIPFLPQSALKGEQMAGLVSNFVSADRRSMRLTVVMSAQPYSTQANRDVHTLNEKVAEAAHAVGLRAVAGGVPAALTDVQDILNRDFVRIALFTIVGVLIVLIVLLRSLVAPIYLVLTVLLSYGSTLGVSTLIFQDLLGHTGINYVIPIVVFVLLVALGADYNIFLMSRVREEAEGRGTRQGIRIASAFTGGIITSCGIILAGTFASMMVAPLQTLFQVGFAVAAGVLVDTFIIRAMLVPALAAALGEKNWWPGKIKM